MSTEAPAQLQPSRGQYRILGRLVGGYRLFPDGFVCSLVYPWSGSREIVSARMLNSLKRSGWLDERLHLTVEGQRIVLAMDHEAREAKERARESRSSPALSTR